MAHQELVLHAIMKGVDKIPDSVWNLIPGHKDKKHDVKHEPSGKQETGESRGRQRRVSETQSSGSSKHRSNNFSDASDEHERERLRKPRRATMDSTYSSKGDYNHEARTGGSRRSTAGQHEHRAGYGHYQRRGDLGGGLPPHFAGVPNALYHPASYSTAPYGQPVPFAYVAVPPMNMVPYHHAGYEYPHSAESSRAMSFVSPVWTHEASRRSSVYSNNNYSPPTNVSPKMQPVNQPGEQAYQTHPAYTNGEHQSTAANLYIPTTKTHDQSVPTRPDAAIGIVQAPVYAKPSPTPCPTCGHSAAPSPLQLPHPQPTHTLSFPFLQSTPSSFARNLYSNSSSTQLPSDAPTPLNLSFPASRRHSTAGVQPPSTATQQRRSSATGSRQSASPRPDSSDALSRSDSTKAQLGRRPSAGSAHQHRRASTTLNSVSEKLKGTAAAVVDDIDWEE